MLRPTTTCRAWLRAAERRTRSALGCAGPVRKRSSSGPPPPRAAFDVLESKLRVPPLRPEAVSRTALVNRLRAAGAFPLVLRRGARRLRQDDAARPVGDARRAPVRLGLDRRARQRSGSSCCSTSPPRSTASSRSTHSALGGAATGPQTARSEGTAAPRLTAYLASARRRSSSSSTTPTCSSEATPLGASPRSLKHVPAGSMLVALGPRAAEAARRRAARGRPLLEIGADELALSRREAELLLRAAGVDLTTSEIARARRADRGLGRRASPRRARVRSADEDGQAASRLAVTGDDRYLADYFRSEYLSGCRRSAALPPPHVGARDDVRPALRRRPGAQGLGCRARGDRAVEPVPRPARPPPGAGSATTASSATCCGASSRNASRSWCRRSTSARPTGSRRTDDPESALDHSHAAGRRRPRRPDPQLDRAARHRAAAGSRRSSAGSAVRRRRRARAVSRRRRPRRRVHALRGRPGRGRALAARRRSAAWPRDGDGIALGAAVDRRDARRHVQPTAPSGCSPTPSRRWRICRTGSRWHPSALLVAGRGADRCSARARRRTSILAAAAPRPSGSARTESRSLALGERSLLAAARRRRRGRGARPAGARARRRRRARRLSRRARSRSRRRPGRSSATAGGTRRAAELDARPAAGADA